MDEIRTKKIRVYGIVQGVGFRPTVSRLAEKRALCGSVINRGSYVEILAQGRGESIEGFLSDLKSDPPRRAAILKVDVRDTENAAPLLSSFEIEKSKKEKGEIFISPDIATCPDCMRELYDPENKRYLHPFINCTSCGPRLTILDELPYDRKRTSMKEFPMCPDCAREYFDPKSRRYDAQPVCCSDCGPVLYLAGREEKGWEALRYAREVIAKGGVAAVKGIGGFHLACDATSEEAVSRLRRLKNRPVKPFAVMMRDLSVAERECVLNAEQREILTGHQKPILLLEKRREGSLLCPSAAPGNPKVGVMLPYAPVQMLLFDSRDDLKTPDMLVMTSGNVSGAPICRDDEEALSEIAPFCDCILSHDRKIRIRCDDSVMDYTKDGPYMIRRSRGYAPLPVLLSEAFEGEVLAVGGELKNTFCIGKGSLFYPSAYIGDLADLRSSAALKESIHRMETLLEQKPILIACDLHPSYQSGEIARELYRERSGLGAELIEVQHHFAHIVSCLAENDFSGEVIGASFDGTGYGSDGSIWGGEILKASCEGYERIGSIAPFLHVGGDIASKEGWRIAVSMLYDLKRKKDEKTALEETMQSCEALGLCRREQARVICLMAEKGVNAVKSTSAGRLFDAVSALLGICRASTFEGEASCALQFAAEAYRRNLKEDCRALPLPPQRWEEGRMILGSDELFEEIERGVCSGLDRDKLSLDFHLVLAGQIAGAILMAGENAGMKTAALSGGVFQNTLLLSLVREALEREGFRVLTHHLIPPNDGGIALGQAVAAMAIFRNRQKEAEQNGQWEKGKPDQQGFQG